MDLESLLTGIVKKAVKEAVREEVHNLKGEIPELMRRDRVITQTKNEPTEKRIIRADELAKMLSVARPTLWRMEKDGKLPGRIKVSNRAYGWMSTDIEEWLESRRQSRDQK